MAVCILLMSGIWKSIFTIVTFSKGGLAAPRTSLPSCAAAPPRPAAPRACELTPCNGSASRLFWGQRKVFCGHWIFRCDHRSMYVLWSENVVIICGHITRPSRRWANKGATKRGERWTPRKMHNTKLVATQAPTNAHGWCLNKHYNQNITK